MISVLELCIFDITYHISFVCSRVFLVEPNRILPPLCMLHNGLVSPCRQSVHILLLYV